ncbi:MAG TPA: hypothetical protein PLN69_00995 [bacterium]|nr:hypothetical protein [bacterium]
MKKLGIFFLLLLSMIIVASRLDAEPVVIMATEQQLLQGIAIEVDGMPGFISADSNTIRMSTFEIVPLGLQTPVQVVVQKDGVANERNVVLPIQIEDKSLARGVKIELITHLGNRASLSIPPKKVFLSIPFTIPVTADIHPDFGDNPCHLILQIVPKITKKAQVNVDNTSTDGLVADIRYEGIAYLKLYDLLNRTNRRDLDGTFFFGKEEDSRWALITENIMEKFDERNVAVMKNQRLGGEVKSQWRLDRIDNIHKARMGLNVEYSEDKSKFLVGNIDRKVKNRIHSEIGYGDDNVRYITRFEGIEVVNPPTRSGIAMKVEKFGYQLQLSGGDESTYYEGRFGNLKVQDFDDEGEIDDYFNFDFEYVMMLGEKNRRWRPKKWMVSGETALEFWGRGDTSWVEGELRLDISYKRDYLMYFRFNDDFARITGDTEEPLWESLFISFMRNRNFFNPNDTLAKFGLESIHLDFDYSREGKGEAYARKTRFGVSKLMKIWEYDIPVEFYLETVRSRVYRPGLTISIRRYL